MIEHIGLPVSNYEKAKEFYKKVLTPLGYKLTQDHPEWKAGGFFEGGHTDFWIGEKEKPQPTHVAFGAKSKEAVQEFYKVALAAGGKDNGAPGFRLEYGPDYYAAFILDLDGSNIEACYFGEKAPEVKQSNKR